MYMKTSKADNKKVKDIIRKAKGLSRKQAEILATIPPNVLYTLINTMSQLVSQNEPELKEGKLVARAREQVSFVLKKLEDEIHRRIKKDKKDGLAFLNRVGALVNMKVTDKKQQRGYLFLKLSEDEFDEDMGTVTGPHIAGTGDDSSVVVVRKKKQAAIQRRQKQMIKDIENEVSGDELLDNFFDRIGITPDVGFAKGRFDKSALLRRSDNPYMRSASEKLAEDTVGNKDYSRSILTADIHKNNYAGTRLVRFYKEYEPAFGEYLKEIGKSDKFQAYNLMDRMEFGNLVSRAIRGEVTDMISVQKGAEATRKQFKKMLDDLKESGVEGAAQVLDNPNYFPRHYNINRIVEVSEKLGGESNLVNFLKNSLVKGSTKLNEVDAKEIAGHILHMVKRAKFSDGLSVDRILNTTDEIELRNLIKDYTDLPDLDTNRLVKVLLKPQPPQVPARLRRRATFDETHEEIINGVKVKFSDLLDNNAEGVIGAYINQMAGHVSLARVGIKSKSDYLKILDQITKGYELPEVIKKYSTVLGRARKNTELETLETIYKNIIGIPTERNITGNYARVARNFRKYNYANVFNQVGFAQVPELGNTIGNAGVKSFIKYIPEYKSIMTREKNVKLSNEFLDEIETVISGTGANRLVDSVVNRTDDFAGMTTKVGKIEKTLDVATKITSDFSGFHAVDTFSRRVAAITSFDKLARFATGEIKLKPSDIKIYRIIGFSDD